MKKKHSLIILLYLIFNANLVSANTGDIDMVKYRRSHNVYLSYCARCHGENADGRSKMAAYYRKISAPKPANFTIPLIKNRTNEYLESVIKEGGEARSLSRFMPPFGQELNQQQISDLVYFIKKTAEYGVQRYASSN